VRGFFFHRLNVAEFFTFLEAFLQGLKAAESGGDAGGGGEAGVGEGKASIAQLQISFIYLCGFLQKEVCL
jgi:hypothetical protein